jgi:hypothetical protein
MCFLDLVIDLLKDYQKTKSKKHNEYDEGDEYGWVVKLGVSPKDLSIVDQCNCECNVCQQKEYEDDSDFDDSDDSSGNNNKYIECTCTDDKLNTKHTSFMLKFISLDNDIIDTKTKKIFMANVDKLEKSIPIDYHPNSNNQVIDLVHPSLYCYVKGVTKTKKEVNPNILFQWLPAEFSVKKDLGTNIKSYINNLDPIDHVDLYVSIANIFEKFVPKFEHVLKTLHKTNRIEKYVPRLSNCQVIVKLANTVLTPDKPVYPTGSWHLEGLPYEKIIATGIYYYEMTNISKNYLNFRSTMTTQSDISYPQDGFKYVETHYGFEDFSGKDNSFNNRESFINLGRVETKEDMCLVFPNFMQHRVSDFELVDKNKIGTRKILVFFLIDPSDRILSTADVSAQQQQMSLTDAKVFRELLMFQRKYEISEQNSFFERGWSLCEH